MVLEQDSAQRAYAAAAYWKLSNIGDRWSDRCNGRRACDSNAIRQPAGIGTVEEIDGGIRLVLVHLVNDAAADIVACDEPVHSNLFLDAQVPLIDEGRFRIFRNYRVGSSLREHDVFADRKRKRIPSRITLPGIVETTRKICELN